MTKAAKVVWAAFVVGLASLASAAGAQAGPPPPCSYTLSPPVVTQVNGAPMVTVTTAPSACGFPANPRYGIACLQVQGDSALQCRQGRGDNPAVAIAPYRPGTTYVATGRGCGGFAGIVEPAPDCQPLGPLSATL